MREGRRHAKDCFEKIASAEDDRIAKASDADIKHLLLTGEYFMVLVAFLVRMLRITLALAYPQVGYQG